MKLLLSQAVAATGATLRRAGADPGPFDVITDTRVAGPGTAFVALHGDRFDGHHFVDEAVAKGSIAVVVSDDRLRPPVPTLVVADTRRAYMQLAATARRSFAGKVVGVTGSAGKTTTKHFLAQLLQAAFGESAVAVSPANENNELGVSKLLLRLQNERVAVAEMGARHFGEIAELAEIARPEIGVLTNIGDAHLEIFGSRERIAQTKWGLFSTGALPILNARDEESRRRASSLAVEPVWYDVDGRAAVVRWNAEYRFEAPAQLPGRHNLENAAAAIAAALALGVTSAQIEAAFPSLELPPGRYQRMRTARGVEIVYDAYNANAGGTIATLDAFASEHASRRIAVLGGMAELGDEAEALHERVGAYAASANLDVLLVGGEFAGALQRGALRGGLPPDRVVAFADNHDAARWIARHTQRGDVILLKGSRKYAMERIVEELQP